MPFMLDPMYLMMVLPALALALWAQARVSSTYARASRVPAQMSGAQAARRILDSDGLYDVGIEPIPGHLSDHYDPRHNVLRLSQDVYHGRTQAAVGIAAHEAGHALQKAHNYAPLVIRSAAVPIASFGSSGGIMMAVLGFVLGIGPLVYAGIALFGGVVFFQVVNLPVEFNASSRAKALLVEQGIVSPVEMEHVNKVLNAAAMTYVAATLQAILTLLWLIMRFGNRD